MKFQRKESLRARPLPALSLIVVAALFSPAVQAKESFASLSAVLEGQEAFIETRDGDRAAVTSVKDGRAQTLFTTPLVERQQDVYGAYRELPIISLSSDRQRLLYEIETASAALRQFMAFNLETKETSPFSAPIAINGMERLEMIEKRLSPTTLLFAGTCRVAASPSVKVPPEGEESLVIGYVSNPTALKAFLLSSDETPWLESPAAGGLVTRRTLVKTFSTPNGWSETAHVNTSTIRYLDWLPDANGFYWLERRESWDGAGARTWADELYFFDVTRKKMAKSALLDASLTTGANLATPLLAISPRYVLCVARVFRYKKVAYQNFLIDNDDQSMKKILPGSKIVGIR